MKAARNIWLAIFCFIDRFLLPPLLSVLKCVTQFSIWFMWKTISLRIELQLAAGDVVSKCLCLGHSYVYWKSPRNEKPSLISQSNFYSVFLLPPYDKLPWIIFLWYGFLFGLFGCGVVFFKLFFYLFKNFCDVMIYNIWRIKKIPFSSWELKVWFM